MKKLIVILLAFIMALGMLACSAGETKPTGPSAVTDRPAKTEKTEKTEAAEPDETEPDETEPDETEPDETEPDETEPDETEPPEDTPAPAPADGVYRVGDVLETDSLRITYMASGVYKSDNQFYKPAKGNQYIFMRFYVENIGSDDETVSYFDFDCYADGYTCDNFYGADDSLSAELSPGRTTVGAVYFEVPKDAEEIEVEYEIDFWADEKVKFIYEGNKDSGFVPQGNTGATADAYKPGDVVETDSLKITYISAKKTKSDNQFIKPKKGHHYVTFSFEFENTSDSDVIVSCLSFDCFADGASCEGSYFRDDDIGSVTLSPGRKTKGTVTFEVPDGAETVEVEYEEMSLFGDRIVFAMK